MPASPEPASPGGGGLLSLLFMALILGVGALVCARIGDAPPASASIRGPTDTPYDSYSLQSHPAASSSSLSPTARRFGPQEPEGELLLGTAL